MNRLVTLTVLAAAVMASPAAAAPIDDFNAAVKFYKFKRYRQAASTAAAFLRDNPDHPKAPLARLYRGQALAELRDYDDARDAFTTFAEKHPTHPELPLAKYRIGEASFFLGDDERANRELTDFLRQYPNDDLAVWGRQYLAELRLRTGDAADALRGFDLVLSGDPDGLLKEDAAYGRARALERLGRFEEAAEAYRPLAEGDGGRAAAALFGLGASLFEGGENDAALRAFDQLATKYPDDKLASLSRLNAGYAAYRAKRWETAAERFDAASQSVDQQAAALYWLGLTNKRQGRYADAVAALERAAQAAPDDSARSKALYQKADARLQAGEEDAALDELVDVATRYPDADAADDALLAAGSLALRMGRLDVAQRTTEAFAARFADSPLRPRQKLLAARVAVARAEADPTDMPAVEAAEESLTELIAGGGEAAGRARVELARLRRAGGRGEEAVTVLRPLFDAVGRGTPDDARLLAASVLLEDGQAEEAAKLAGVVAAAVPVDDTNGAAARQILTRASAKLNRWDAVAETLAELDGGPDDKTARAAYADAAETAYAAGEYDRAERWFRRAADGEDVPVAVRSGLGYSLYEKGQFGPAAIEFQRLQSDPNAPAPLASNAALMRGLALEQAGDKEAAGQVYAEASERFATPPGNDELSGEAAEAGFNAYQLALKAARVSKELGRTDAADGFYERAVNQLQRMPPERRTDLDKLINEWALTAYEAADATGDFARSDALFRLLIEQTPDSKFADDAKLYLAESAFFGGDLDGARGPLTELSRPMVDDDFVRTRAALLLVDLEQEAGNWRAVAEAAERLRESRPSPRDAAYADFRLGEARLKLGDAAGAAEVLDPLRASGVVREDEPWRELVWVLLAEALMETKDYRKVGAVASDFEETFADSDYGYRFDEMRGRALKNQAKFPEARQYFERVVDSRAGRRTETAAKAQFLIGETFLLQKRYEEAGTEYFKVYVNYAFPEWQAPALFQAAAADEALGNTDGAAQYYGTLAEEFPESEYAAKAQAKLETLGQP